jgi:predicted transcriptional regulator of viral defense system
MKYVEFEKKFRNFPVIHISNIKKIEADFDHRRLYEWQKRGYIKKVINNFYIFSDKNLSETEHNFIANRLIEPSYLSMEYVLNYYSLIPEIIFWRTSITSKKTAKFSTPIGNFSYQKMKKDLFFGYKIISSQDISFKIAEPEKAILDFLYLKKNIKNKDDFYELRINEEIYKEIIDQEKMKRYLKVFNSKKLTERVGDLNNFLLK